MSNIAGKAYAMNLVTPIRGPLVRLNKFVFWAVGTPLLKFTLRGLTTLSMIHYARWVIVRAEDFPRLSPSQPRETLRYGYMLFCTNFNGSWEQYVDAFAAAIPSGLNRLWFMNVGWPTAVPEQPFHRYVEFNQVWTDYYYNSYPLASANDVKAAARVKDRLCAFVDKTQDVPAADFMQQYHGLLKELQGDLGLLDATPIVSLAAQDIAERKRRAAAQRGMRLLRSGAEPQNDNRSASPGLRKSGSTGERQERSDAE